METLLIAITIASAATALGLGAVVVKMLRTERSRSDARVEALMEMAVDGPPSAPPVDEPAHRLVPSHFHRIPQTHRAHAATLTAGPAAADDLVLNEPIAGVGGMFLEPERHSPWRRRFGAAAACAAVAAIIGSLLFSGPDEAANRTGTDAAVQERAGAPLELLSLRHSTDDQSLTITGIVQNPRGGALLSDVIATAALLGRDGSLLATGRAPLDFTQLRPGDESPFVVRIASAAGVARYRVSFRSPDGGVIGHVDRRSAGPLARND